VDGAPVLECDMSYWIKSQPSFR